MGKYAKSVQALWSLWNRLFYGFSTDTPNISSSFYMHCHFAAFPIFLRLWACSQEAASAFKKFLSG